jgi:hypothetical protein
MEELAFVVAKRWGLSFGFFFGSLQAWRLKLVCGVLLGWRCSCEMA